MLGRGQVDLLFDEAAVNDATNGRTPQQMLRGMEGIVRHARRSNPNMDVVVMHFVDPEKMAAYNAGRTPEVISVHERVARHYGVTSINLALEVTQRINAGEFTWKDDFRNLHPSPFGQKLYHHTINRMFDRAWAEPLAADTAPTPHATPAPLDRFNYSHGRLAAVKQAELKSGFTYQLSWKPTDGAGERIGFVDVPMVVAEEPGAALEFTFRGSAVGLFVAAGPDAGIIEFRIDGGTWQQQDLFTRWSSRLHLPWAYILDDELSAGEHQLAMRMSDRKHDQSQGHACRIVHFLVNDATD